LSESYLNSSRVLSIIKKKYIWDCLIGIPEFRNSKNRFNDWVSVFNISFQHAGKHRTNPRLTRGVPGSILVMCIGPPEVDPSKRIAPSRLNSPWVSVFQENPSRSSSYPLRADYLAGLLGLPGRYPNIQGSYSI
jgi:hypothetical protein